MNVPLKTANGLDHVIAADTELSHIDGEAGLLIIRGRELPELVRDFSVEGTIALLWENDAAASSSRLRIQRALGAARAAAHARLSRLLAASGGLDPVEGLRSGLAALSDDEREGEMALTGAAPVLAAALLRRARGLAPIAPDPNLTQGADYLRMIRGGTPDAEDSAAMDAYLTTIADHGLNASTFAARIVASTGSGSVSAVVAALGALKGPLHGGAPGPVLDMLDAIETHGDPERWIAHALEKGERLMGFGHRIYRVRDPRADILKAVLKTLKPNPRLALAERVEAAALKALAAAKPDRRLDTNVEFYTALLLESLGIARQGFTPTFAVGRIAGWCAHILEQRRTGRLIRPQSNYIGPMPKA